MEKSLFDPNEDRMVIFVHDDSKQYKIKMKTMHDYIRLIHDSCKLQYRQWSVPGSFMIVETIVPWIYSGPNYYRAEIVEFLPKGKAKVMLLDVGEYRDIACHELYVIPSFNTIRKCMNDPNWKSGDDLKKVYNVVALESALVYRIELNLEGRCFQKSHDWLKSHLDNRVSVIFDFVGNEPSLGDWQLIRGKIFDSSKNPIPITEHEAAQNLRSGNQDFRMTDPKWQERKNISPGRTSSRMSRSSSQSSISSSHQTIQKPVVKVPPRMSTKSTLSKTNTETTGMVETNRINSKENPESEIAVSVAEFALNDSNEDSNKTSNEENFEFEFEKVLEDAKNLLEKLHELPSLESVAANNVFDIIVKR